MGPRLYSILLLLIGAVALSACGLLPEQEDKTKNWSAERFYTEASSALADGNYGSAIEYYEKLDARYPYGRYAMQGKLDLAYAYYKDEEPESAIEACDRFIQLYPDHPAAAYAWYLKGIVGFNATLGFIERFIPADTSQRDPGTTAESMEAFRQVVERYPDSVYAKDARKRIIYLRNNLARNEIHAARYYMDRGAYLAAAKRAAYVVENYQRTPSVLDALNIMIEAYTELGMPGLADDARRVLALNLEQGKLISDEPLSDDDEESLLEDIWKFFELDKG